MGLGEMLKNTFTKNSEIDWMFDLDLLSDTAERDYLKRMAINTVLDYVGKPKQPPDTDKETTIDNQVKDKKE